MFFTLGCGDGGVSISLTKLDDREKQLRYWMGISLVAMSILAVMTMLWYFVFYSFGLPEWATESDLLMRRMNILVVGTIFMASVSCVFGVIFSIYFVPRIIKSVTIED